MLSEIITLVLFTLLPFLELRASIPYGILVLKMHWPAVFLICVTANILLAPALYIFLDKFVHLFLKIKTLNRMYQKYVDKTQKKIHKYVDKYGTLGIAVFIGIPLPGTGVYSAAIGAYAIGMHFKSFFRASVIGVLIAGIIITLLSVTGSAFVS